MRIVALLALLGALRAVAASVDPAAAQDIAGLIRNDQWAEADAAAAQYPDPVARKIVSYFRMLAPNAASADEIAAFIADNPDWPTQQQLERRRDEALATEPDDATATRLCNQYPPKLGSARAALRQRLRRRRQHGAGGNRGASGVGRRHHRQGAGNVVPAALGRRGHAGRPVAALRPPRLGRADGARRAAIGTARPHAAPRRGGAPRAEARRRRCRGALCRAVAGAARRAGA